MDSSTVQIILLIIHTLFFIYAFSVIVSYIILAIISGIESNQYMKKTVLLIITKYFPQPFLLPFQLLRLPITKV